MGVAARITYVGHATALLELGGVRLLTDPVLRPRFVHVRRRVPAPDPAVAERIDGVLISHLHGDHLDPPSLRAIDRRGPILVTKGGARMLRRRRFEDVIELEPGESTGIGEVEVTATPAVHDARRYKIGRRVQALGYVIAAPGGPRVYFAGDTDVFDEMNAVAAPDVAMLPVSGWGSPPGWGHLDPERAVEAAEMIRPRIIVPIHWGTFSTASQIRRYPESLTEPPRELERLLGERLPDIAVQVLEPGESLEL